MLGFSVFAQRHFNRMFPPSNWGPLHLRGIPDQLKTKSIRPGQQNIRKHRRFPLNDRELWAALTGCWLQGFPCCPSWCTSFLSPSVHRPVYRRYIRPHRKLSLAEFLQTRLPAERKEEMMMKTIFDGKKKRDCWTIEGLIWNTHTVFLTTWHENESSSSNCLFKKCLD